MNQLLREKEELVGALENMKMQVDRQKYQNILKNIGVAKKAVDEIDEKRQSRAHSQHHPGHSKSLIEEKRAELLHNPKK